MIPVCCVCQLPYNFYIRGRTDNSLCQADIGHVSNALLRLQFVIDLCSTYAKNLGLQNELVTQFLCLPIESFQPGLLVVLIEMLLAQISEGHPVPDNVVNGFEEAVGYGNNGSSRTSARLEPIVLCPIIRTLRLDGCPGHFDHDGLEVVLANRAFTAVALACTFIISRAKTRPRADILIKEIKLHS
jgi:hypothetical protein